MTTKTTINFDMDGTIADLYGVNGWLADLENENTRPYDEARPLLRFATLARLLNNLQRKGYKIAVISWLAKKGTPAYDRKVTTSKMAWLKKHLPSVKWDNITIVPYGTPKEKFLNTTNDILFDDEQKNRENWKGVAYDVNNILGILKTL